MVRKEQYTLKRAVSPLGNSILFLLLAFLSYGSYISCPTPLAGMTKQTTSQMNVFVPHAKLTLIYIQLCWVLGCVKMESHKGQGSWNKSVMQTNSNYKFLCCIV